MTLSCSGLVVDVKENRLYWVNTDSNSIQYYDHSKQKVKTMQLGVGHSPTAAIVYNNIVYYAEQTEGAIVAMDKEDGSKAYNVRNNTGTPFDVTTTHDL